MKVIKQGKIAERKPDYVGQKVACPNCKALIELEEGDVSAEKRPGGRRWVNCPTEGCSTQINVPVYRSGGADG